MLPGYFIQYIQTFKAASPLTALKIVIHS